MKNLSKNFKTVIYIIIIILLIILLKDWWKPKVITLLGGYVHKIERPITVTDTIIGRVDTLEVFARYVHAHGIILNPKPVIIEKQITVPGITKGELATTLKEYKVAIEDSIIKGTITVSNRLNGDLDNVDFYYKPLVPYLLSRTDTIYKTTTNEITLSNERSKLGIGVGYNNLNYASGLVSYTTKKGWQVIGEYGKNINNTSLKDLQGVHTFFTPSKDFISLKLIKNF